VLRSSSSTQKHGLKILQWTFSEREKGDQKNRSSAWQWVGMCLLVKASHGDNQESCHQLSQQQVRMETSILVQWISSTAITAPTVLPRVAVDLEVWVLQDAIVVDVHIFQQVPFF